MWSQLLLRGADHHRGMGADVLVEPGHIARDPLVLVDGGVIGP